MNLFNVIFRKDKDVAPKEHIQTEKVRHDVLNSLEEGQTALTWLGHSTVFINTKALNILIDPVLSGKSISPLGFGNKPFPYTNARTVDDLPETDVVLISHDHYDHLDMKTIKQLTHATFYVPLGVRSHLVRWGVPEERITEFDWYESTTHDSATLHFTPSRHFSGRGLFNGRSTLWGSWVIAIGDTKIYFGGDSGYSKEFKKIGEEFGPFDVALLDTGQYNDAWKLIHMSPEESVQAAKDLQARALLPIHNSKFVLSMHAWYEPLERVMSAAKNLNQSVTTPKIGQTMLLDEELPNIKWWV